MPGGHDFNYWCGMNHTVHGLSQLEINLADLIGYSIHIFSVQKLNKDSFTFIEQICLRCNYGH